MVLVDAGKRFYTFALAAVVASLLLGCGGGGGGATGEDGGGGGDGNTATRESIFFVDPDGGVYPVNEILISVVDGTTEEDVEALAALIAGEVFASFPEINAYFLSFPSLTLADLNSARLILEADSRVRFTTTNNVVPLTSRPPTDLDQLRQSQLSQSPTATVAYELVEVFAAWDLVWNAGLPVSRVAVGIIDSGIDATHPEFQPVRVSGFLEDLGGTTQSGKPVLSHGTEVAGIVGAANHLSFFPGTSWEFPQMNGILAGITDGFTLHSEYYGETLHLIFKAINKAIKEGDAQVVNMSFGFARCDKLAKPGDLCIKEDDFYFHKLKYEQMFRDHKDVLFVAAAGNSAIEAIWHLPGGGARSSNLITVAATATEETAVWMGFSNGWSDGSLATGDPKGIDIAAPGQNVLTPTLDKSPLDLEGYTLFSGTSAAAPIVTGVAAMMKAINPELGPESIKAIIKEAAWPPCEPGVRSGCRLNAEGAVAVALGLQRDLDLKFEDAVEIGGVVDVIVFEARDGTILGVQSPGSQGVIVSGPILAQGTWWWKVDFESGADGWVSDEYLNKVTEAAPPPASTDSLNDTGIDWCGDGANNYDVGDAAFKQQQCDAVANAGYPGQDGHYGRDAAARAGTLEKVGAGAAGFDYTKIANNGSELPASATLGSGPNDWACTRDNVTGLIWEVKVDNPSHMRHQGHTYTWYDPNSPDGDPGTPNRGICTGSNCDTTGFVQAVNAQGLCGVSDWGMPTRRELQEIVDYGGHSPAIDTGYFPNTPSHWFWSGSPLAHEVNGQFPVWRVSFSLGDVDGGGGRSQYYRYPVRLVRGGK